MPDDEQDRFRRTPTRIHANVRELRRGGGQQQERASHLHVQRAPHQHAPVAGSSVLQEVAAACNYERPAAGVLCLHGRLQSARWCGVCAVCGIPVLQVPRAPGCSSPVPRVPYGSPFTDGMNVRMSSSGLDSRVCAWAPSASGRGRCPPPPSSSAPFAAE